MNGGALIMSAFFWWPPVRLFSLGFQQYQQKRLIPAAFVAGLAVSPLVFTLIVHR